MEQNCPNLEELKEKVEQEHASAISATNQKKVDDIRQSRRVAACCCIVVGAMAGEMIAFQSTLDKSQISKALVTFGSETFVFQTGNAIQGLKSMMEASHLSDNLQKNIQDRIAAVNKCLTGFFKLVFQFQEGITSI